MLCKPVLRLARLIAACLLANAGHGCADHAPARDADGVQARDAGAEGDREHDASSTIPTDQPTDDAGRVPADGGSSASGSDASVAAGEGPKRGDGGGPLEPLPASLSAAGVRALFPPPAGERVCLEPALRVSFAAPPALGNGGKLQVFDAAKPAAAVFTLDMSQATTSRSVAGVMLSVERSAYVEGNDAVLYLPAHALSYGHEYFVLLEAEVIRAPGAGAFAIDDASIWRFRTQLAAPSDKSQLSVALDGNGDFCSLQAALDAASGSARITIARGSYHGVAHARDKRDLTLSGADRKGTVLTGTNNDQLNSGTSKRALISFENSRGIVLQNLTIHNLTPQGGSQAEALRLEKCDQCSVRDADILSLQDTLLWSGRLYAQNTLIAGNVDFIWGTGAAYFERCEIKTLGRKGYTVQARNGAAGYGYVFVDSKLTSDPGITGHFLARIDASVYPQSHVAYIDCELGDHIDPAGFLVSAGSTSALRFEEYQSKRANGAAVDVSKRAMGVKQLSREEAAMMRDPKLVLGGWAP